MLKQVGLLTAGAQPWNSNICSGHGKYFAFCATLAVYIYEYDSKLHEYHLHSIMCEHKKTISSITWSCKNPDIFVTTSADQSVIVWNVPEQTVIAKVDTLSFQINSLEWYPYEKDTISILSTDGKIYLWKYNSAFYTKIFVNLNCETPCIYKWNKKSLNKMCMGHTDGSLTLFTSNKNPVRNILSSVQSTKDRLTGKEIIDPIIAMEWDPLSTDYIIISNDSGLLRLVDIERQTVITNYIIPKTELKVRKLCWLSSAPGMFLTGDAKCGILRLWSVATSTPILQHQVKETGFHSIHVIDGKNKSYDPTLQNQYTCSNENYAVPPAKVISVFKDGGVGLYELKSKRWEFIRDKGHVETIFDCAFHPDNPDLLATASFDGTIKVWDITTMTMKHESPGNLSIIYSIAWAPADLNCICAATSKNGVVLWNLDKNQIVQRFNDHGNKSVYHCCWNVRDPRYLASAGADGNCIVRMVDGGQVKTFAHPEPVYGCDWNPKNRDLIATGCEDAILRVFYLSSSKNEPLKSFKGHTAKIFGVKWCPSKDGILCTGSDDKTIRIWDYCQDECLHCLEGHSGPVRGLLWNPEIPNILISGSWDYTIRVWDTRTGYCLDVSNDHAADIYGLAAHHQRPFLLASSSRDSTVRLWILHKYAQPALTMLLTGADGILNVIKESDNKIKNDAKKVLNEMSGTIIDMIKVKQKESLKKRLHLYSHVFLPPLGVSNLWLLISILQDGKKVILPDNYEHGIMHSSHLKGFKMSKASELEIVRSSFKKIMGPKKKEQQLLQAADIYISLGELQQYCEIMVELNKWEKALCVAPGVSMEYWKNLTERYVNILDANDNDDAVKYCMVTNNTPRICEFYSKREKHYEAMVASHIAFENNLTPSVHIATSNGTCKTNGDVADKDETVIRLYNECNENLSESYLQCNKPVQAACSLLAVDNVNGAACKLIRGNELELAFSLTQCFKVDRHISDIIHQQLSLRCQSLNMWKEAVSLLKYNEFHLLLCCSQYPAGSDLETNDFFAQNELDTIDEFRLKSEQHTDKLFSLLYLLVVGNYDNVITETMKQIKTIMKKDSWNIDTVFPYLQIIQSVKTSHLQQINKKLRQEILSLSAYVGALKAIQLKLNSVIIFLFQHASYLLKAVDVDIGVSMETINKESEAWLVNTLHTKNGTTMSNDDLGFQQIPTQKQIDVYESLHRKCKSSKIDEVCMGDYITACDNLPSHCQSYINYFNKKKIKGSVFILEDGRSAIPLNIALMWACVNRFSPLANGDIINPF